jgi:ketosteroid isomerase-like protein
VGIVERYLAAVRGHDWDDLHACVADDVVRTGPYGDVYEGRDDYVAFLAGLMPTLQGYAMEVHRVAYSADGRVGVAELTETVEMDGRVVVTPEALVFDLSDRGLIARIGVFLQRSKP